MNILDGNLKFENMKNRKIYFLYSLLALFVLACDPLEDRMNIGSAITAEELNISATPLVVNGKKSNKVILINNSPVLSSWNFGVGVTQKMTDTVLMVATGQSQILFTGRNPDGTTITKTLTVDIDELTFEVPLEWGYLTGGSEKTWVWDTDKPAVWGNGGYKGNVGPAWWTLQESEINGQAANEGVGAKMIFYLNNSELHKVKSNGTIEKGSYKFEMDKQVLLDDGSVWAKGKLTTKGVTVLCGKSPDEGGIAVYEYDIMVLNGSEMMLSYAPPGTAPWGPAWFWAFKVQ